MLCERMVRIGYQRSGARGRSPINPKNWREAQTKRPYHGRRVHGYLLRDNERDRNARGYSDLCPHGGDPGPPHRRHSSHAFYHQGAQVRNAPDSFNTRRNSHVPDGHGVLLDRNGLHLRFGCRVHTQIGQLGEQQEVCHCLRRAEHVGGRNFIPMFAIRDAYFAPYLSKFGEEYVSVLMSLTPPWTLPLFFVVSFVSGVIGGLIGRKLYRKHFERAGIA